MALVSKVIPSLHNGISQQPPVLRLDTQCEDSENGYVTLVDGMGKRPPTEHLAVLSSKASATSFIHTINRDSSEQYAVILTGDATEPIEIYRLPSGEKCTVQIGSFDKDDVFTPNMFLTSYLTSLAGTSPLKAFKATTVADYTIITNNTVTCAMSDTVTGSTVNQAIVSIKRGVAGTDYEVTVNGLTAAYTTGATDDYNSYKSDQVATSLKDALVTALGLTNWDITQIGSIIHIKRKDNADFTIQVHDSWGEQASGLVKGSIQKFTDLPVQGVNGFIVEVSGEPTSDTDNYWVVYETNGNTKTGVWQETVKPGLKNSFNPATMPHKLIRSGVKQFQFGSFYWEDRKVGDDNTVSPPSFIGKKVNDVFFYRNRLCFLSGENIIMSRASKFFNFWPTSATTVVDDDPIDVAVSTNEVSTLYNAIPFQTTLLALGDQQQFQIGSGDSLLTASTVRADPSTHFPTSRYCKPVASGSNVYFASPRGDHATLREYFVQPGSQANDAADVTAHVPQLLPKSIIKLTASTALDVVVALSDEAPNTLYVYKYYWNGDEKAQSAWLKWTFDGTILNAEFLDTSLFLIIKRGTQVCLERIRLEKYTTGSIPYRVHLDRQVAVTGTYSAATGKTTWTLPYQDTNPVTAFRVIRGDDGNQIHLLEKPNSTTITAPGNYSGYPCHIGINYTHRHRFSEWHIRANGSNVAVQQGRLIIRTLTLTFTNAGYFKLQVTPEGRPTKTAAFNAVVLGQYYIGTPALYDETKRFDIVAKSDKTVIEIVNDSHLPAWFHSGSFEGTFIARNQQI